MKCEEKEIVHHWNMESVLSLCSLRSSQRKKYKSLPSQLHLLFYLFIFSMNYKYTIRIL